MSLRLVQVRWIYIVSAYRRARFFARKLRFSERFFSSNGDNGSEAVQRCEIVGFCERFSLGSFFGGGKICATDVVFGKFYGFFFMKRSSLEGVFLRMIEVE